MLRFGLSETETGSYPLAVVRLPRSNITVELPRANTCSVGSRILLYKRARPWGTAYFPQALPCA